MSVGLSEELKLHLRDVAARLAQKLDRHRERYIRAWIAWCGLHPSECELVQWTEYRDGIAKAVTQVRRRTLAPDERLQEPLSEPVKVRDE